MSHRMYRCYLVVVLCGFFLSVSPALLQSQHALSKKYHGHGTPSKVAEHGEHQTPAGWTFTWPQGDPLKGRAVFVKLECYSCHAVKGEHFPDPSGDIGPELSAMGPLHDAEYFAESIINPNAVIEKGKGYEASDGSSKMPSYNELMTVQEVIDLVGYLRGLKPPPGAAPSHGGRSGSTGGRHRH
jgi:mono/diheme cytochrome c family protein